MNNEHYQCNEYNYEGEVWGNLDRPTVVQHIVSLTSLAVLAMDYRRAYGDQSAQATEVSTK